MDIDIHYLAESLSTLCGMPVRIYKDNQLDFYFSKIDLEVDPIKIDLDKILLKKEHLGYYQNEFFFFYCFINYNNEQLILGPSREINIDSYNLTSFAIKLGIKNSNIELFKQQMSMIVPMPLNSILQALASFNYILNNEKVNVSDILLSNTKIEHITDNGISSDIHNNYEIEKRILKFVCDGDIEGFNTFVKETQSTRGAIYTADYIRNLKDTFIVLVTLISREAIKAGLDMNESISLCENYINKIESMNKTDNIINMQYKVIEDYINKVRLIKNPNAFVQKINNYILNNLSTCISTSDVADYLYMSRSNLCKKFKEQVNTTLSDYILLYKIEYSKTLLRQNMKISDISSHLGFSSQQHFTNTFKKYTNVTPQKYKTSNIILTEE